MSKAQQQVQEAIDRMVESGTERGLQVAAYRNGEQVIDAVAGVADPDTGRTMTNDTPIYVFSVVKGAATTLAHRLVEQGRFRYETPVVELWPEFGAHGKEGVTVRHVLNHSAGVPGIPLDTTVDDLCDWDHMCAAIADEELWWEPGTKIGYHAYTFGYIVGEIVRRATGHPISEVLRDEVAGPLGVADELYFGMPESEQPRLAKLEDAPWGSEELPVFPPDLPMFRSAPPNLFPNAEFGNRPDVLAADIPAGGKCSARAAARLYAALLGEVDGVRLISPETLREATAVSMSGVDEVFGMPTAWGLGFGIGGVTGSSAEAPTSFGVGGVGGSFAGADTATGISYAVTKNRLGQDFSASTQIAALITTALTEE